ncbi:transcription elongation factor A protein 3 isoform X6 [Cyprinodon tularosa]|uniref:transcription elongation factor A protein 3 isoform X6 n=2 Tax=Cyprinodon tularosa TaxID=77115 RepID=UPI0018E2791D|nr:transcription elongation factor A protein 3 isoform X6 [Cyprinodon tularosa]
MALNLPLCRQNDLQWKSRKRGRFHQTQMLQYLLYPSTSILLLQEKSLQIPMLPFLPSHSIFIPPLLLKSTPLWMGARKEIGLNYISLYCHPLESLRKMCFFYVSALIPFLCSSRKSSTEPKKKSADCLKKDRRDSDDGKTSKKLSDDAKRERKDSSDSKAPPSKKVTSEVKKEKHRKDPSDLKPCHAPKGHSTELKHIRRESTDSKRSSSPPAKKITAERRESLGSKPPGQPLRKSSTDSIERKGKIEAPRTPTTPTSPMSPSFNSPGGPLPPHLATGDSVRDKCIEMLAAALRTDNDYKDFGANCDSMAAEIEDHIYQEIRATDMKYKNRVRSRISNLKDPKNPGLRRNVLAGSIELSRMASMSAEEMASDELKQLRNVLTQEAIREHQMAKTGGTTTDLLQCGKCKKKNCTYNQVQTRSADEPMTTFVLCNECGNRWKFC